MLKVELSRIGRQNSPRPILVTQWIEIRAHFPSVTPPQFRSLSYRHSLHWVSSNWIWNHWKTDFYRASFLWAKLRFVPTCVHLIVSNALGFWPFIPLSGDWSKLWINVADKRVDIWCTFGQVPRCSRLIFNKVGYQMVSLYQININFNIEHWCWYQYFLILMLTWISTSVTCRQNTMSHLMLINHRLASNEP